MIYLDNAATTYPKPYCVRVAVDDCLKNFSANPGRGGHELSLKASEKVYICRKKAAKFFGCEREENVIFTQNCTTSINMVLKGILKKGDHVICSALEQSPITAVSPAISPPLFRVSLACCFGESSLPKAAFIPPAAITDCALSDGYGETKVEQIPFSAN